MAIKWQIAEAAQYGLPVRIPSSLPFDLLSFYSHPSPAVYSLTHGGFLTLQTDITCTYDILSLEQYKYAAFNGVMHLASMQAAQALALLLEAPTIAAISLESFILGQQSMC